MAKDNTVIYIAAAGLAAYILLQRKSGVVTPISPGVATVPSGTNYTSMIAPLLTALGPQVIKLAQGIVSPSNSAAQQAAAAAQVVAQGNAAGNQQAASSIFSTSENPSAPSSPYSESSIFATPPLVSAPEQINYSAPGSSIFATPTFTAAPVDNTDYASNASSSPTGFDLTDAESDYFDS